MNQEAIVKQKKPIYIIWIIPLIAMTLAGWMIFKYYDNKGYDILVTFDSGDGFAIGKTPLIYNGIKIGMVSNLSVHPQDITKVDVTITVDKAATGVAKKGNIFWKVEPVVSLTEVSGLSTILSGVYIGVMPATKNLAELSKLEDQTIFTASLEKPVNIFKPGTILKLKSKDSDIKEGAPILYKNMNIGKVLDVVLKKDYIEYKVLIEEEFSALLKDSSQFYKISGVEIRASLAGLRVQMDSLASVIAGGIAITSPESGTIVKDNKRTYTLYEDINELHLNNDVITLVSRQGYNVDTKITNIYFKGSNAGKLLSLDYDPIKDQTTFKIKLKSDFRHLANKDAYFWIVKPKIGLTSIKGLDALATGVYINFSTTSKSPKLQNKFKLNDKAPQILGKHFKLVAKDSFGLKNGINIVHKDIIIGSLVDYKISKNKHDVVFDIVIDPKYKHLVNDSSNFYIKGALEMSASFQGAYLNIGSIASMVNGGIVLKTDNFESSYTDKSFTLYDSLKKLQDALYTKGGGKYFNLRTNELGSIKEKSPILYKGIKVGQVISYELDKTNKDILIKIYIEKKYTTFINKSSNFFNISGIEVKANLEGIKIQTGSLESMVTGGIAFKTPMHSEVVNNLHEFKLYKNEDTVDEEYININFTLTEDTSLSKGSKIIYKSIKVGEVKELELINDNVIVNAIIESKYKELLVEDSLFWIEDIEIDIDKIENPSSIISGAFIKLSKGHSTIPTNSFELLNNAPVPTLTKEGLRVVVVGEKLSSLKVGSPVFYRQIQIGSVEAYRLSNDSKGIELKLYIDKCYSYLVRKNSIFYNAGAIGVDVSLFGVKISTETLSTMLKGGITMVTPDKPENKAENMSQFKLHVKPDEDWLEYTPKLINDDKSCKSTL